MTIKIFSNRYGELNFTGQVLPDVARLLLPGAEYRVATTPDHSFFLFQEFEEDGIKVRFSHFSSRHKDTLLLLAEPMTTLRIALSHSHQFYLPQLGLLRFEERNFNLLHIPHHSAEFFTGEGESYSFADIILPQEYLLSYEDEFSTIAGFHKLVGRCLPAKLSLYNQVAGIEILRWLDVLLEGRNISRAVAQLIYPALQTIQRRPARGRSIRLKQEEIEKIYQAADLLKNCTEVFSLLRLAKAVAISPYRLNRGFRQIYGHTVLEHRKEEKMRLAIRLIEDRQYPIKQVADILDYWPQNFIRAFKGRFGYTPGRNPGSNNVCV
jgi:AraC-like DNA-binding protein